jgi:hypothetical protein
MLADSSIPSQTGRIEPEFLLPATAHYELIEFIAQQIPYWRDHPDRPHASSETVLTDQLCDYLNSATYDSTIWDHFQFRTEVPDKIRTVRTIDLAAKPRAATLIIGGRWYKQFDTLLPIECKRLPTPKEKDRDEREYVITEPGTTGGIQRFKFGYHGAAHLVGAMIAYVQEQSFLHWASQINCWIQDLSAQADGAWSDSDLLHQIGEDTIAGLCTLHSHHGREGGLEEFELRHLWVRMN